MKTLEIRNFGQIKRADIDFSDLTVLVGPQATGKSITLQLLKLLIDTGAVQQELKRYGIDWSRSIPGFFDIYFGEGMRTLWHSDASSVSWGGKKVDMSYLAGHVRKAAGEKLFYIPAQRVLALREGWPRPFTDYAPGDPFAVREFSEKLRVLVEREFLADSLFPQEKRLKKAFRELLERDVFGKFRLEKDRSRLQKRLVLGAENSEKSLPYMVWSAGQREFVPLLLGLYWLMPPTRMPTRDKIKWVIIEELEMGLHPRAISVVILMILELLSRGYKACISTHSPQVLECIWALKHLKKFKGKGASGMLLDVFGAKKTNGLLQVADSALNKDIRIYYFDRKAEITRDISDLNLDIDSHGDNWGGLSEFSNRANDVVSRAVANSKNKK